MFQKINKVILLILFLLLQFLEESLSKLLVGAKFGNLLLSLNSLSSESLVAEKSANSWGLVILLSINFLSHSFNNSLLNIDIADSDFLKVLGLDIVRVLWQSEKLSDLVGSLWSKSILLFGVSKSRNSFLSLRQKDQVERCDFSSDDASSYCLSLVGAFSESSVSRRAWSQEQLLLVLGENSLFHGESCIV